MEGIMKKIDEYIKKCNLVLDNKELYICEDEYKRILSTIHINRKYTNKN